MRASEWRDILALCVASVGRKVRPLRSRWSAGGVGVGLRGTDEHVSSPKEHTKLALLCRRSATPSPPPPPSWLEWVGMRACMPFRRGTVPAKGRTVKAAPAPVVINFTAGIIPNFISGIEVVDAKDTRFRNRTGSHLNAISIFKADSDSPGSHPA